MGKWLALAILTMLALALWQGWLRPPPAWNPWSPLDLREPANALTRWKLARLRHQPQLCAAALATSTLKYHAQADTPGPCPLSDVVRVSGGEQALSSSFIASCPMAVAFALFSQNAVQPAAQRVFGQAVARIDHLGSFACRNIYGRVDARRSLHASANAIDIAGFRMADGRQISVLHDWGQDTPAGRFLREVRDGACDSFGTVLGPDYNAAHRNHLHMDTAGWALCR
ncbi:extensin family protein [Pseudomonas sp. HR96]|uniref:extensin-like domain-containing protein n=1 Tax=Pseudomonas sp. HR96 TaxID=1027966 RepID=UPI002A74AF38|nr:extensin family protein [Pseudomonas sp. HR96]WPP01017.1 extensin family protein [Pseudomonas sp. HR96]